MASFGRHMHAGPYLSLYIKAQVSFAPHQYISIYMKEKKRQSILLNLHLEISFNLYSTNIIIIRQ